MQKQAPSVGRILVAVGFALSCFALLLFLWVTFGGPIPFKPASYRFTADFPEAITLSKEAEVRIGGVSVGKVKELELPADGNATRADDRDRARVRTDLLGRAGDPAPEDAARRDLHRADHRQPDRARTGATRTRPTAQANTLDVGEISGDDAPNPIEEGGHLEHSQVQDQVQIDEIFQALDDETRQAFQLWMKNSAHRDRRPRPRPQRRLRQPRALLRGRQRRARRPCASQEEALREAGPLHGHRLRGAHAHATRRSPARSSARTGPSALSPRATRRSPRRSGSSPPSRSSPA